MTQHLTSSAGASPPRFTRPLRVAVGLNAALVLAQAAFAGQFLGGNQPLLIAHQVNAEIIPLVALAQLVLAVLVWRPGRGPGWPAVASALLLVAVVFQIALGWAGQLALHVPLGVAIFGLTAALLASTRPLAREARP